MASDLLPQPVYLFLHTHVSDRENELLDAHLLVDQVICIWVERLFTSLECCLELLDGKRHGLAILLHQLTQLDQAGVKGSELLHQACHLCF